jgi:hypothetical protein
MNTPTMHRRDRRHHHRRRHRCWRLAILAVLLLVPLTAIADTPAPTAPPATAPAAPPPSPKAVALAFTAAIEKGDAPAAKALLPTDDDGDDGRARWVDATVALTAGMKKLDAAAVARFGDSGKGVSQNQLHLGDAAKTLEQAQEKIDGDTATLVLPGQAHPLVSLKKVDGKWRLLAGPASAAQTPAQLALCQRLLQAATRTADEISAGNHPTADSAGQAFAARVLDARLKQ